MNHVLTCIFVAGKAGVDAAMSGREDREEGGRPSKSSLCGEHEAQR